jgi:hypothetical protein
LFATARLATIGTISVAYCAAVLAALHLLDPATDAIGRASSEYVLGPYGYLMTSVYLVLALALIVLAAAFTHALARRRAAAPLVIASATLVVSSIFPTDRGLVAVTPSGTIHNVAGLVGFISLVVATVWLTRSLARDARFADRARTLRIVSPAVVVAFVANFLAAGPLAGLGVFGLAQRTVIGLVLLWLFAAALQLRQATNRISGRTVSTPA